MLGPGGHDFAGRGGDREVSASGIVGVVPSEDRIPFGGSEDALVDRCPRHEGREVDVVLLLADVREEVRVLGEVGVVEDVELDGMLVGPHARQNATPSRAAKRRLFALLTKHATGEAVVADGSGGDQTVEAWSRRSLKRVGANPIEADDEGVRGLTRSAVAAARGEEESCSDDHALHRAQRTR